MSVRYESLKSAVEASETAWKNVESKREEFIRAVNSLTGRFFDKDTPLHMVQGALDAAKESMLSKKRKFDDLVAAIETLDMDSITKPKLDDECYTTDECDDNGIESPVLGSSEEAPAKPRSGGKKPVNSMYQDMSQFC